MWIQNLGIALLYGCSIIKLITYHNKASSFIELLQKDKTVAVHWSYLEAPATALHEVKLDIASNLIKELFALIRRTYDLKLGYEFKVENVKTIRYGTKSLSLVGPKLLWKFESLEIKSC